MEYDVFSVTSGWIPSSLSADVTYCNLAGYRRVKFFTNLISLECFWLLLVFNVWKQQSVQRWHFSLLDIFYLIWFDWICSSSGTTYKREIIENLIWKWLRQSEFDPVWHYNMYNTYSRYNRFGRETLKECYYWDKHCLDAKEWLNGNLKMG